MSDLGRHLAILWAFLTRDTTRGWFYRVCVAAGAVAAGYGLVSGTELALWLGLVSAVLGFVPAAYTPVGAQAREAREQRERVRELELQAERVRPRKFTR